MIILNSLKLLPYIHGYLFILANTEIYGIKYKTQLSRRHLINLLCAKSTLLIEKNEKGFLNFALID